MEATYTLVFGGLRVCRQVVGVLVSSNLSVPSPAVGLGVREAILALPSR